MLRTAKRARLIATVSHSTAMRTRLLAPSVTSLKED
eukprot:COSAG02_NODE_73298_length_173_cov_1006.878378_1_plen_35_part_10